MCIDVEGPPVVQEDNSLDTEFENDTLYLTIHSCPSTYKLRF